MAETSPMQAAGTDMRRSQADGVSEHPGGLEDPGQSGGGAYPNPHRGKTTRDAPGDFMGHGGQTENAYHGGGQLGDRKVAPQSGAREAAAGGNREGGVRQPEDDLPGRRRERTDEPAGSGGLRREVHLGNGTVLTVEESSGTAFAKATGDAGPAPSASRSGPSLRRSSEGQGDDEQA